MSLFAAEKTTTESLRFAVFSINLYYLRMRVLITIGRRRVDNMDNVTDCTKLNRLPNITEFQLSLGRRLKFLKIIIIFFVA